MKYSLIYAAVLAAMLPVMTTVTDAADQDQTRDQERLRDKDQVRDNQVYGSQLMTTQERDEYRNRMRAAKTVQEREQIRNEHHARMQERAKQRGVTLPAEPPVRGMGAGPGRGAGSGAGPGGGPR